jgi:positive regulator of sigma E activity
MQGKKQNQEISVVGRLVSLEALVFLMGVVSLIYGLVTLKPSNIIIGAVILLAAFLVARRWRRAHSK